MLRQLLKYAIRATVRSPGKSWVYTSAAMLLLRVVSRSIERKELIDLSTTKPGDRLIIEHLEISHAEQMKQLKRERKSERKAAKQAKKSSRHS